MKKVIFLIFALLVSAVSFGQFNSAYWHNSSIKPVSEQMAQQLKLTTTPFTGCIINPVIGQEYYNTDILSLAAGVNMWNIGVANSSVTVAPVGINLDYLYSHVEGHLTDANTFHIDKNKFSIGVELSNALKLDIQNAENGNKFILNKDVFTGSIVAGTGNFLIGVGYDGSEAVVHFSWTFSIPNTPVSKLICIH
jgi:hypothetical protein